MYKRLKFTDCDFHSFDIGKNTKLIGFFYPLKEWSCKRWVFVINQEVFTVAIPWFRIGFFPVEKSRS